MAENAPENAPDIVFEEDDIGAGAGDGPVDAEETETEKMVVEVPETTAWGVVWRGMSKAQSLKAEDAAAATMNAIERNAKPEGWEAPVPLTVGSTDKTAGIVTLLLPKTWTDEHHHVAGDYAFVSYSLEEVKFWVGWPHAACPVMTLLELEKIDPANHVTFYTSGESVDETLAGQAIMGFRVTPTELVDKYAVTQRHRARHSVALQKVTQVAQA